ncbi:unnamed protein product [Orchesella dallaii]|uniref:Uncharacterized protein n=1 Tax=Orchesella dallaii TaxID=48710 RepID=A0ABP1QP54_9HEXA
MASELQITPLLVVVLILGMRIVILIRKLKSQKKAGKSNKRRNVSHGAANTPVTNNAERSVTFARVKSTIYYDPASTPSSRFQEVALSAEEPRRSSRIPTPRRACICGGIHSPTQHV